MFHVVIDGFAIFGVLALLVCATACARAWQQLHATRKKPLSARSTKAKAEQQAARSVYTIPTERPHR